MTGIWARQPGRSRAVGALLGVALAAGLVPGTVGYAMAGPQTPATVGTGATDAADAPAAAATEKQALAKAQKSGEP